MPRVIVAGSEIDTRFAVIDFTNPALPSVVLPNPGFGGGCRGYIDETTVGVGSVLSGAVTVYDVMAPSAPVQGGTINTMLAGIGAIAVMGTLVAVGEWVNSFAARVKLIDFSNPMLPVILGTAVTPFTNITIPADPNDPNSQPQPSAAIASIAFVSGMVVVAAGPSGAQIAQVDFTNPALPVV